MLVGVIDGNAIACGTDICNTPLGTTVVPVPYPNIWDLSMSIPVVTVTIGGIPAMNLDSTGSMTSGDEAGTIGGIISGTIIGEAECITGATTLYIEGIPAILMGSSTTMQNSDNAAGSVLCVGQSVLFAS